MSRCFGDTKASSIGIISIPNVVKMEITSSEAIIILGSDGLFEFLSNKEVIFCRGLNAINRLWISRFLIFIKISQTKLLRD